MMLIKAVVVAKAKVKAPKAEQRMVKREKKSRELKQKVVEGLKAAREHWQLKEKAMVEEELRKQKE